MKMMKMRSALLGLGLLFVLLSLGGCLVDLGEGALPVAPGGLHVSVSPASGYYPLSVSVVVTPPGVGGQYTFTVEGHTYTQGSNVLRVVLHLLPCEGEVIWERQGQPVQRAQFSVALDNRGPVVGRIRLNGLDDLWYLHPRTRYLVDTPDVYDPEGGPVELVAAHVKVARKAEEDTVFCPPYAGPGVYHAFDRNHRLIDNAFVFHCTWTGALDAPGVQTGSHVGGYTYLPFSPPGYGESGYPGQGVNCGPGWPKGGAPATTTTITETWRDRDGAETTVSWDIPTGPDPGCNTY